MLYYRAVWIECPMAILFCHRCVRETEHVRIYVARKTAGVSRPTIYRWIETGDVHACRGPGGLRMVCRESLVNPAARLRRRRSAA